jgi:hypothetical protein
MDTNCMTLQAISSAATIALASTIVILLAVKSWHLVAQPFANMSSFPDSIMVEAAQRFRDQLERLKGEQALYLTLTLMFLVTFGIAVVLRPQDTYGALPNWQSILVLAIVALGAAYGFYRLLRVMIERRRVAFVRDANIAIGHSLQRLTANQNRVFHEVKCAAGVIDNVVVGLHGIYAVNVVAERPGKDNRVRLRGEELSFAPGKITHSTADTGRQAKQLMKILQKQVGHAVRVRAVVAVPGWEIESQTSENYLLVNEHNLAMMRGWKDEQDYLMNEDVDAIHNFLTALNTRYSKT